MWDRYLQATFAVDAEDPAQPVYYRRLHDPRRRSSLSHRPASTHAFQRQGDKQHMLGTMFGVDCDTQYRRWAHKAAERRRAPSCWKSRAIISTA